MEEVDENQPARISDVTSLPIEPFDVSDNAPDHVKDDEYFHRLGQNASSVLDIVKMRRKQWGRSEWETVLGSRSSKTPSYSSHLGRSTSDHDAVRYPSVFNNSSHYSEPQNNRTNTFGHDDKSNLELFKRSILSSFGNQSKSQFQKSSTEIRNYEFRAPVGNITAKSENDSKSRDVSKEVSDTIKELQFLNIELQNTEAMVSDQQDALAKAQDAAAEALQELRSIEEKKKMLTEEVHELKMTKDRLNADIKRTRHSHDALSKKMVDSLSASTPTPAILPSNVTDSKKNFSSKEWSDQLDSLREEKISLEQSLASLKHEMEEAKIDLEDLRLEVDSEREVLDSMNREREGMEREMLGLESTLLAGSGRNVPSMSQIIADRDSLLSEVRDLADESIRLQRERDNRLAQLKNARTESEEASRTAVLMRKEIAQLMLDREEILESVGTISSSIVKESTHGHVTEAALNKFRSDMESQKVKHESAIAALKSQLADAKRREDQMTTELKNLEVLNEALSIQSAKPLSPLHEDEDLVSQLEGRKQKIKQMEMETLKDLSEIDSLKETIEERDRTILSLRQTIGDLKSRVIEADGSVAAMEDRLRAALKSLSDISDNASNVKSEHDRSTHDSDEARKNAALTALSEISMQLLSLTDRRQLVINDLHLLEEVLNHRRAESYGDLLALRCLLLPFSVSHEKYEQHQQQPARTSVEVEAALSELHDLNEQLSESEKCREELIEETELLNNHINALESELRSCQNSLKEMTEIVNNKNTSDVLESPISSKLKFDEELEREKRETSKVEMKLVAAKQQVELLTKENAAYTDLLKQRDADLEHLRRTEVGTSRNAIRDPPLDVVQASDTTGVQILKISKV